jgi:hypothetical protein
MAHIQIELVLKPAARHSEGIPTAARQKTSAQRQEGWLNAPFHLIDGTNREERTDRQLLTCSRDAASFLSRKD